jgi:hypothetical protein
MSIVIKGVGEHVDPPVNSKKDGDYYDTCPQDGCIEVDVAHRNEGQKTGPVRRTTTGRSSTQTHAGAGAASPDPHGDWWGRAGPRPGP